VTVFRVVADPDDPTRGRLSFADGGSVPCALGRSGTRADKREGDGATPVGTWPLRRVWYRADRLALAPATALPTRRIRPNDGWCDDAQSVDYNRPVVLPHPARHERLWRDDEVYDVVVELGCNDDPPVPGRGSAIFLHVARSGYPPTEGCVALAQADLLALLGMCQSGDSLRILSATPVAGDGTP
jgi:L,D-peptidoglycan transpeptidase YkuD (ErfK/YbiS/YcfS/YnhG family)